MDCLRLGRTSEDYLIQSPAQAEPPRAGCPGPRPGRISPRPLWVVCASGSATCTSKKYFLMFRGNILCSILCPVPPLPLSFTHAFCILPPGIIHTDETKVRQSL